MLKNLPLSEVYTLLEPGPVVLLTTAHRGRANVMTLSWHMMMEFNPPLLAQCFADLECKEVETRLVPKYNLFVLEVVQAWIDPRRRRAKTLHHHGHGTFVVDGETIHLRSGKP